MGIARMAIAAALIILALPANAQPASTRSVARPPNVIILLADDWGFSDVGAFGGEMATPNIDWLAANGVRYANFHVAGSCSPTRAMLQTGVSNHRAGLGNMPETIPPEHRGRPGYDTVLSPRAITIAEMLRQAGYRTYLTGKWHLGKDATRVPSARGYDRAFSLADAGADNFAQRPIEGMYAQADWTENGRPARLPTPFYSSTFIVDQMINYIEQGRSQGRPFLASLNFLANHIPVQAHDADIARYANRYRDGWTALRNARARQAAAAGVIAADTPMVTMATTRDWAGLSADERAAQVRVMQAYGAMATAMDREIGRLIAYLRSIGELDNSIFIFLSDNGPEPTDPLATLRNRLYLSRQYDLSTANIGRPGSFSFIGPSWASAAAAPLAGYKFSAAEGGLRVPLVIAWPGNAAVRRGVVVPGLTHVTDIVPTILSLTGVSGHDGNWQGREVEPMRGRDLSPTLTGTSSFVRGDDDVLGYELSGNAALFMGRFKLVRNLPPVGDGRWRLFDIMDDPGETVDLASSRPELLARMQAAYAEFAERDGVLEMPPGYSADDQINAYAFENNMKPRLLRMAPWAALVLALLIAGPLWWLRRRRHVSGNN